MMLLAVTLCTSTSLFSSHISGGEFHWECQGSGMYRIGLTLHRDCAGATLPATQTVLMQSSCFSFSIQLQLVGSFETSQLCPAQLPNSTCNGGALPGTEQYTYSALIPLPTCGIWTFSYTNIYRNEAIVNLATPGNKATYIMATMNSSVDVCQDSPLFINKPIPFVCLGEPVLYSFGVTDPTGDVLSYHFVSAKGANGNNIPYVAPNSGAVPIPGITLDQVSGEVQFTPMMLGNWVVVVRVDRRDTNGNLVASIIRDMQFVVHPCSNQPPDPDSGVITNLTGTAVQTAPRAVSLCPNGSFCFDLSITDPNPGDALLVSNNIAQALPGATLSTSGTNPLQVTVCWTPSVSPGVYTFQMLASDNACPILALQTYVYTVLIRPLPLLNFEFTPESCPGAGDGTLTAIPRSGGEPFTYVWNVPGTGPTITGVAGSYNVVATDAFGCESIMFTGEIPFADAVSVSIIGPDSSCAGAAIQLQGVVVNGTDPVWNSSGGTFIGNGSNVTYIPSQADVLAGSATITLSASAGPDCPPVTSTHVVGLANSFLGIAVVPGAITCNGSNDGTAVVEPVYPTHAYTWSFAIGETGPSITDLTPGQHSVTITHPLGCDTTLYFMITEPEPLEMELISLAHAPCDGEGSVEVLANGGTSPYVFAWSNGSSGATMQAQPGTYSAWATDVNGCPSDTLIVTIEGGTAPPSAHAGEDLVGCMGDLPVTLQGSVVNAQSGVWSGGSGSFNGSWPDVQYMPSMTDVQNGGVELTLTTVGSADCPPSTDQVWIALPNSFEGATLTGSDALCHGAFNGTASFSPVQPGSIHNWSQPTALTSPMATGLGAGPISVQVIDAYGCDTTLSIVIGEPEPLLISDLLVTHEGCAGDGDGSVLASVNGGTAPYLFAWSNGSDAPDITVVAGAWALMVTDANGCSVQDSATVLALGQPNAAQAGMDLVGCMAALPVDLNGSVTHASSGIWSGGSGTFSGTWPAIQYTPSAADIQVGSVELSLTTVGNTACPPATDVLILHLPNSFAGAVLLASDVLCNGTATGTATFTPNAPDLDLQWNDAAGQSTFTATGLVAGQYTVVASDTFGCDTTLSVTVGEPEPLSITDMAVTHEICAGDGNGSVSASVSGGTLPYVHAWNNGASSPSIAVGAGTWEVVVTDANGCSVQASATVNTTAGANTADAGPDLVHCHGDQVIALNGSVTNASGGSWSGGTGTFLGSWPTVGYLASTADVLNGGVELMLTTVGSTGCPPATDIVFIALSNAFLNASLTATDALCHDSTDGSIVFTPHMAGNTYLWDDPAAQTTATATGLPAGIWTLIVSDGWGCDTTLNATIQHPEVLIINDALINATTCHAGDDGSASLVIEGGTPTYSVTWSNGSTGATIVGLEAGSYTASVSDAQGCTAEATVIVEEPEAITLDVQAPDTVCINVPMEFSASAKGGTGSLEVNWGNLGVGGTVQASFSQSQTVQVTVSDATGCVGPLFTLPITVLDLNSASLVTHGDTTVCAGGSAQVRAELFNYAGEATMVWPQLGAFGNGPFTVPVSQSIDIVVQVTDVCSAMLEGMVELRMEGAPDLELNDIIAEGCAPLGVAFPDLTEGGTWLAQWDLGNGQSSTASAPTAVYLAGTHNVQLTLTSAMGCSGSTVLEGLVVSHAAPDAAFSASAWSADMNTALIFTDESGAGVVMQQWSFGDGGHGSGPSIEHVFHYPGTYEVMLHVVDGNGCSATVSHQVEIDHTHELILPNAFSPSPLGANGGVWIPDDLSNDVFYAFAVDVADFNMRIHNRWGEMIFESSDVSRGWDGYYLSQLCPQDVYMVRTWVRFKDGQELLKYTDLTLFR